MRQAHIFYKAQLAGILTENDAGYEFRYLPEYLSSEGWLLDVALRNTDISILDRMSLLLTCCKDCIGAVSVVPMEEKEVNHV